MTKTSLFNSLNKKIERLDQHFSKILKKEFEGLTSYDLNLAAYLHLGLSTREIGLVLNIAPESVKKAKYRLRKKLDMKSDMSFADFFSQLAEYVAGSNQKFTHPYLKNE